MLSKKDVKDIQSLRLKKHRDETGLFVAEGPKVVPELAAAMPQQIVMLYATEEWIQTQGQNFMPSSLTLVSEADLKRISQLQTPNQVVGVFRQMKVEPPVTASLALYLDAIQDPGNLGTIVRIADWFGVAHVVCSAGCADVYNFKVVQSTMASLTRVLVYYDESGEWLQQQAVPLYAATLHGQSVYEFGKTNAGILLIGNESKGLRKELIEMADHKVTIPQKGAAESLNAAVATGIILSHLTE